ncbi:MAG: RNA polymerase sigma factor for flagellar operon FliA [Planctomycetota bacterium]
MNSRTSQAPKSKAQKSSATAKDQREVELEALWKSYRKQRSTTRRNRLVERYHLLVEQVVRRMAQRLPRSVDRGDLTVAATVGLIGAVEGFDHTRGVRFELYGEQRVRGACLDELRTQDWLPRPWRQRLELQKRTLERLRSGFSREPSDEEVAEDMGLAVQDYQQTFGRGLLNPPTGNMAADGTNDSSPSTLEEVSDPSIELPGERLTREELLSLVAQRLSDQEYRVVYLKYWEELSMREIGEITGLSESRVCKIHSRLIERLRDRFGSLGA